jgi:hypothetical protein
MAVNPLSLIHDAVWAAVSVDTELNGLIKAGNRIKLDERASIKNQVQDADLPELILIPRSGVGNLTSTSSSVSFELTFDWLLSTGDLRVNYRLYPVLWSLYRAMSKYQRVAGAALYNDKKFITGVAFSSVNIGESDAERNRGIKGFSSVFSFVVKMSFGKDEL